MMDAGRHPLIDVFTLSEVVELEGRPGNYEATIRTAPRYVDLDLCTGCGQCSDVCPVNIPVATIFSKVGDALAEEFEYVAGRDAEEELPLGTYKADEYSDIGE